MKILSIETSCDETGVSLLECDGSNLTVLGNALASQVELHAQYGGVFPAMAKRAHAEKIVPLLQEALSESGLLFEAQTALDPKLEREVMELCKHEESMAERILAFVTSHAVPDIDRIAVTAGPGLEPALWVGINAALAFGKLWNKPVHPIDHMEGHVMSAVFLKSGENKFNIRELAYPSLALLVSGGHTELVLMEQPLSYKKIGQTKDDAVGEAFDKVARILGLPYPGGPKISALAKEAREEGLQPEFSFPRPMIHSGDCDFSYSGLKTAVLYQVRDLQKKDSRILENLRMKKIISREFEEAAIEVLVAKTKRAIEEHGVSSLILGGGVANNDYLREQISDSVEVPVYFPSKELTTDNSVMIGMVLCYQLQRGSPTSSEKINADGNRSIENK